MRVKRRSDDPHNYYLSPTEHRLLRLLTESPRYGRQLCDEEGLSVRGIYVNLGRMVEAGLLETREAEAPGSAHRVVVYIPSAHGALCLRAYEAGLAVMREGAP